MSFNEQFDQHGAWRREFALRLKLLAEWMKDHDLLDAAVEERLQRLESQVRSDKVMVAFVAEFSRGKSELINAIFFAGYGRRIMPASAGRTTMCPTELGYDADVPPCLRLLPIETRLQKQALMEWRAVPEKWTRLDLDVNDPAQLAQALEKVAEVRHVTKDEARALGFWHDNSPEDNPLTGTDGLVEVPKWRHALINIAHPLLKQGLVILDTPGLNAIGAEPELTVSLIPQAHAVVFILAADTGVTKSDLSIWREHLITDGDGTDARLVVLNKIDTLWDALSTPEQVKAQIDRQRATSAEILGLPESQVIPVSAQKGLVAKVTRDKALLEASHLPALELALGQGVMGQRQKILRTAVGGGIGELRTEAGRAMHIRRRDLAEQMIELRGLRGKNISVIKHMRSRIEQEQSEFDTSGAKIQAVRSVHLKLLREVFNLLSTPTLKAELAELTHALKQPGIKLGVKKAYGQTFSRLREGLQKSQILSGEIQSMLTASFRQLNAEFSFSLQAPKEPELIRYEHDLEQIERSHLQYLGVGNVLKLSQPEFSERLVRALATRLRVVYESALGEVELWNKSAASQLDAQLRERRRNFGRRLEAIERIQQAASGLDERIAEIDDQEKILNELDTKLTELTSHLISGTSSAAKTPGAPAAPETAAIPEAA
ncbi:MULTISPECIES: dynamin family protein [unclassified Polaromonas]|uniref:dynamin family protein n=1 Tax=unclassified Polaromonas TaxID=2638319 RepID=UPI000F0769C9|nr:MULTISPECIES: dynamin family protein [unclassified Polaromonas]AYQ26931.1 dynamin family protein [Polaromonas sp. SP1]QGJ18222.1 dynamin family protein [Polaromonas sp. Pch-P]